MKFLKNHFEKLLVGLAAIGFVVSVGIAWVMFEKERKKTEGINLKPPTGAALKGIESDPDKIIARLEKPDRWERNSKHKFFTLPMTIWEVKKPIGPTEVRYQPFGSPIEPIIEPGREITLFDEVSKALHVAEIREVPFSLIFWGKFEGAVTKVQIKFAGKKETPFKVMGDTVEGFKLVAYRPKTDEKGRDISELDIQRGNEPVITLTYRKEKTHGMEREATLQERRPGGRLAIIIKKGDVISVDLDVAGPPQKRITVKYTVVDILPDKVVLINPAEPDKKIYLEKSSPR